MSYFLKNENEEQFVLVATSGDTGSAVAHGFYKVEGVRVVLLYPKGQVSELQEMQFTTLGENILALEVDGSFDDCQHLVKTAFVDEELRAAIRMASANSINIARLLPQSFYYFSAYAELEYATNLAFCIPSGNFGNVTAGLIARRMGLPIDTLLAATNSNDVVPRFLETDSFDPKPSIHTISNAMDVGNPSNFERMLEFFPEGGMQNVIFGQKVTEEETRAAIANVYNKFKYIIDPHGAVGYHASEKYLEKSPDKHVVLFETAHPAKFKNVVEEEINRDVELPDRLASVLNHKKLSQPMSSDFKGFKELMLSLPKKN